MNTCYTSTNVALHKVKVCMHASCTVGHSESIDIRQMAITWSSLFSLQICTIQVLRVRDCLRYTNQNGFHSVRSSTACGQLCTYVYGPSDVPLHTHVDNKRIITNVICTASLNFSVYFYIGNTVIVTMSLLSIGRLLQ